MTCNKPRTVEALLKMSPQFRKLADRQKDKELVVLRDGKALSTHAPCTLLQNGEHVTVKFVKAVDQPKKAGDVLRGQNKPSSELLTFHVLAKGGKNVKKIISNPALRGFHEVTVYAYKGEKVKQALKRDGRFLSIVFTKNCALSSKSDGVKIELSNLVDDLSDKTFQVVLLDKDPPSSSLDEAYLTLSQTQSDSELMAHSNQTGLNADIKPKQILQEIPNSTNMKTWLSSQFNDSVKAINPCVSRLSRIQNLLRVEFGQSAQMCHEVRTMKKLMELSDSVCQVRINGRPYGSGSLCFGCYVITNGHVVKDVFNENRKLDEVSVHFSYESLEPAEREVDVVEVVGFENHDNEPGRDWALLKLSTNRPLPAGLLTHMGVPSKDGGICIIGHPDGGVKKIGPCLIIPSQKSTQVVERHYRENESHVQLITNSYFEQQQALFYESCFYFGSSGAPVFDKNCNVIAIHIGGYYYQTARGQHQSVIEYGHPFSAIMGRLLIQMVERKRVDVLKDYLACDYKWHHNIVEDVKKLVESRNISTFRDAANELVKLNDGDLKAFCQIFTLKEEPVPMDID